MKVHAIVDDLDTAQRAVAAGATVIQLRVKAPTAVVVERGRGFIGLGVTFIVNDDVDAAIALEADGAHLGREDEGIERAREANLLLGLSAQTLEEALAADNERPDYLGAGPVWATPIKPGVPALGLDGLAEICESVAAPVVAIGGVDATNAALCLEAGAIGVAVVRASTDAAAVRTALERAAV
jgi:thiamine-phosphate pyrophosphorylase